MKFPSPILDRYIVLLDPVPEEKSTGLIIPNEMKDYKPRTATVMIAGKGRQAPDTGVWIEQQAKKGDKILLRNFGFPMNLEGKQYNLIVQEDIVFVY